MKTVVHRVTAWLLACTLALGLAACGDITPEDAETYIQGLLDASYLGQYDQDYLDLAGITEEESREEDYEWNTTAEADILRDYLAIQPTDAAVQQSVDLVKEIYSHSKYEVGTDLQHLDSMIIDYSGQYCDPALVGQDTGTV